MYDLSDFTTFERMMLYYDSLNRKFKLNENKVKCFIMGNKSEKKMLLNKEDNEKMNSFFKLDSNFKKFEISNKLHFNFSKFLNELIENCVENDMNYDKEKLKSILEINLLLIKQKEMEWKLKMIFLDLINIIQMYMNLHQLKKESLILKENFIY